MKRLLLLAITPILISSCEDKEKKAEQDVNELIGASIRLYEEKKYAEGLAKVDSALTYSLKFPKDVTAYTLRGKHKFALDNKKGACEDWQDAIGLDPKTNSEARTLLEENCL